MAHLISTYQQDALVEHCCFGVVAVKPVGGEGWTCYIYDETGFKHKTEGWYKTESDARDAADAWCASTCDSKRVLCLA